MLDWLARRRGRKRIARLFGKYMPADVVEQIIAGKGPERNELSAGRVEYIFVFVQGTTPDETVARIGSVVDLAAARSWMVQHILCNLVVIACGAPSFPSSPAADRGEFVRELLQSLGYDIKIVHGVENTFYGNIGSATRCSYSFLLPSFLSVMSVLQDTPPGESQEFRA